MVEVGTCLKIAIRFIASAFLIVSLIDLALTLICDTDLFRRRTHQNMVSINHAIEILIDLSLMFVSFLLMFGSFSCAVMLLWLNTAPLFILADSIQIILDVRYHPELSKTVVGSCLMVLVLYIISTMVVAVYYSRVTTATLHSLQDQDLSLITIVPQGFSPETPETSSTQPFQDNSSGRRGGRKTEACLLHIHAGEPAANRREIYTTD